jgi:NAD(P)-dependent dehydrogenase (short-subunit alcohol dehydrogenase family)
MQGTVVLITGAGRGIGASVARLLHQRGARLALVDVRPDGLQALNEEIGEEAVAYITCDVNDFAGMQTAVQEVVARFGGIDVVLANAGVEQWEPVRTVEPEDFRRVIETNVIGVFNSVRVALPSLIDRRGYVMVVSSVSSYTALPGMASYAASKAAVEQFANVLRMEMISYGVGVGSAHMSLVDTPMLDETRSSSEGFATLVTALPTSMRRPVTVERCATRLVEAIEHRRRYVDVPRWVTAARWLKPLLSMPIGQRPMTHQVQRNARFF